MDKQTENEINLEEMITASKKIEGLLNTMILDKELSLEEIRSLARDCMKAVDSYTGIANKNIMLLKDQVQNMWDKVRFVLEESEQKTLDSNDESDIKIH